MKREGKLRRLLFWLYLTIVITLYEFLPSAKHFWHSSDFLNVYQWLLIAPSGIYGAVSLMHSHWAMIWRLLVLAFAQVFVFFDVYGRLVQNSDGFSEFGGATQSLRGLFAAVAFGLFGVLLGYLAWLTKRWVKRLFKISDASGQA